MTTKALYTGTFDPLHLGHLDIIERASQMFDLTVVLGCNPDKSPLFSDELRCRMLVENRIYKITADSRPIYRIAEEMGATVLVRGVRTAADTNYEQTMATYNRMLGKIQLETVILFSRPMYAHISSSAIKQLIRMGEGVGKFVPENVNEIILETRARKLI